MTRIAGLAIWVVLCFSSATWADSIRWSNGALWNGATTHAIYATTDALRAEITYRGKRNWYSGIEEIAFTGTIAAASREAAIRDVQVWQPGANRPSIRQQISLRHLTTAEGIDGVAAETWVADYHAGSLPDENVYDTTCTVYDYNGFSTRYAFTIDQVSGTLWARNRPAIEVVRHAKGDLVQPAVPRSTSQTGATVRRPRVERPRVERPGARYQPATGKFVGNLNSKTLHTSDCASVKRMSETNKVYFSDRDKALAAGYTPCKRCNP
jgi:hypothetical protein